MPVYPLSRIGQPFRDKDGVLAFRKRHDDSLTYEINLTDVIPDGRTASSVTSDVNGPTLNSSSLTAGGAEGVATVSVVLTFTGTPTVAANTLILAPSATSTNIWYNRDSIVEDNVANIFVPLDGSRTASLSAGDLTFASVPDAVMRHSPASDILTGTQATASSNGAAATIDELTIQLSGSGEIVFTITLDNSDTIELPVRFIAIDRGRRSTSYQ